MKKIVVLGAGYAGVLTAKKLAKSLKKRGDIQISIIDKNPFHTMLTELHEVAAGRVGEDSIRMSLEKIFAGRGVEVILDTITALSFEERKLTGNQGEYSYDYLVLAAGSKPTYFGVPGAEEYSYHLWSYRDAVLLRERIHECFRLAACEPDPEEKKRLLTFYVVGAGFTGVEMAGELAEYAPILCEEYGVSPSLVTMADVDVLKRTVPILPEKLSGKVQRRLEKMHVRLMMETGVTSIGPDYIELDQNGSKKRYPAGTVIWTAGIESADITAEAAGYLESAKRGRIAVDPYLRAVGHEEIYVVGDNMMYIPEGGDAPVPQMVENCEQSAATAARNITSAVTGSKPMVSYRPVFHGIMVSIGGRYGVARVGFPGRMFNLPSFLAMFAKHLINVVYFVQVLGWNKVVSYLRHEFFTVRHRRSFLGGHFSNRTPSFLLVPLRIWLGAVWVFEGVMKVVEGWFKEPKLTGFFGNATAWFNGILYGSAPLAGTTGTVTDAVSSASTAADAAGALLSQGTPIFSYRILGLFDVSLVTGRTVDTSTLSDYAFRLNVPFVNWIVEHWILSNDTVQLTMQIIIVVIEILIGLALAAGLFNFAASAISLVLQVMFVTTTGLYLSTVWMIFAAVAVLIGGGQTLGLDYYLLPWLKKKWRSLPFIRKWYLYND